MSSQQRNLALLFISIALLAGCQTLFTNSANTDAATPTPVPTPIIPDKPTYIVQKGQVINQIEFSGRISAVEETSLYFKSGGFVKRVLFTRGDIVKEGDLLAELEIDDLLKAMAQAQVSLDSAQLRLDEAQNSLERQVAQAELNLTAAETRLAQAEIDIEDSINQAEISLSIAQEQLARLRANQANINAEVLSASINLTQSEEALVEAQTEYDKALNRTWEAEEVREAYARQVRNAEWNLQMAQARYNQALAAQQVQQHDLRIRELQIDQAEVELVKLQRGVDPMLEIDVQRAQQELARLAEGVDPILVNEVSQAQLSLERLQAQVADAQIISPMSGEILNIVLRPGRSVEAFSEVVVIADPVAKEVSAALSDSQMEDLFEGQQGIVTLGTLPNQEWIGTIRRLPYPYGSGGGTQTLENADTSARLSLKGDLSELELGDRVNVDVILEDKEEALWLPPEAIRTFQGREFVIVQEPDRQRRVDVRIGIESRTRVEIIEGLEENQVIVGQ